MKTMIITCICAAALLVGATVRAEAPPSSIYYQGRLLDAGGDPVDATIDVEVRLFTEESGGTAVWSQALSDISVVNGLYSFFFGDGGLAEALANDSVWLESEVDGETLAPRQRLISVPYALRAATAGQLDPPMSGVPTGVIIMWSGGLGEIPDGWALCDGLNGTPDLRERFVMGAGVEDDVGDIVGANSLVLTAGQLPSHAHTGSLELAGAHAHTSPNAPSGGSHTHSGGAINNSGSHTHSIRYGNYSETGRGRPGGKYGNYTQFNVTSVSGGNHTHTYSVSSAGNHTHTLTVSTTNTHAHTVTLEQTGGSEAIDNRPAYFALAFIMKL